MKKFSSIADVKVTEEPQLKISKESPKIDILRNQLMEMMNNILKIQSSGAARTELINSAIKITGKEELIDAIIDLIQSQHDSENVKLLESLKLEMSDWLTIDNKINQLNQNIHSDRTKKEKNIEKKIVALIEVYGEENDFEFIAERYSNKLKNTKDLKDRILISESIINHEKYSRINKQRIKILIDKLKRRLQKI